MKNKIFILFLIMIFSSCSEDKNLKLSSPYSNPIKAEIKLEQGFEPIQMSHSGATIDLSYKTIYTASNKREFKIIMSNNKLDKLIGLDFKADFFHYSKLLVVEYKSLDSVKQHKYYNNPISWDSDIIK